MAKQGRKTRRTSVAKKAKHAVDTLSKNPKRLQSLSNLTDDFVKNVTKDFVKKATKFDKGNNLNNNNNNNNNNKK